MNVSVRHSPVVILGAELEVAEHHRDVRAGDDEDDEHKHEETEHVVVVSHPQGLQDEEHLDENRAVRKDASHRDGEAAPQEPRLVRDLTKKKRWETREQQKTNAYIYTREHTLRNDYLFTSDYSTNKTNARVHEVYVRNNYY